MEARSKCIQDRRKWTRAKIKKKNEDRKHGGDTVELENNLLRLERCYRGSRKKVVRAICKAKESAWKELISEIDKDQWGTPYKVIMNKLRPAGPGLTETLNNEILEKLIFKLFPRETEETKVGAVNMGIWKDEWDISATELCNVITRKCRNTAPGPDGITMRMWRKVPGKMIEKLVGITNKILKEGKFPKKWKLSKLVLIPKAKNDVSETPKARPICLIDDIGKCLEKIIVERIEHWMGYMMDRGLAFASIGNNQYGFRKNRSTVDALSRVKEIAEEARRNGDTTVMICLDIENAFNSIPWGEIRKMLVRKRVPAYLTRILNNYFKDRLVEFSRRDGSTTMVEVQKGVPQGTRADNLDYGIR